MSVPLPKNSHLALGFIHSVVDVEIGNIHAIGTFGECLHRVRAGTYSTRRVRTRYLQPTQIRRNLVLKEPTVVVEHTIHS